jgi:hypothetical protein
MKRLIIAGSLLFAGAGIAPAAEWGLPWFHTRSKPVVLEPESKPARVTYHGTTAYSASGRLFFPASRDMPVESKREASREANRESGKGRIRKATR